MNDELRKTVREVIETVTCLPPSAWTMDTSIALGGIVHTLRAALAKPVAAPQREWVGLTDNQKDQFVEQLIDYGVDFVAPLYMTIERIDAALKAKNANAAPQDQAKDAARYRWLRDHADQFEVKNRMGLKTVIVTSTASTDSSIGSRLSAAIDSVILEQKP